MKRILYILVIAVLVSPLWGDGRGIAQTHKIDSLLNLLKTTKEDTNKAIHLKDLCWEYQTIGSYDTALYYGNSSLQLAQQLNFKQGIATSYGNIGVVYMEQGDYPKALEYYFKGLKMFEEFGNKSGIARYLGNIGSVYNNQGDYPKALEYYLKALKTFEALGDKGKTAAVLGNIGIIYWYQGDYPKALDYNFRELKIAEELGAKILIASSLGNIGIIYHAQKDYPITLEYYFKALKMAEEIGDRSRIAIWHGNIGSIYTTLKKYSEAEKHLLKSLSTAEQISSLDDIKVAHQHLSELYEKTGSPSKELEHYKKYITARDSIFNQENTKKTVQTQMTYEFEKKELAAKAEQDKKDVITKEELKRKEQQRNYFILGFALVGLIALFIFRSYRQKQKANIIISQQKTEVEKSKQIIEKKNLDLAGAFKNIEIVSKIGQKITSTLNLGEVIETLHGHINSVMDASGLVIYIYNPLLKCLEIKYTIGKHESIISPSIPITAEDSFCAYSLINKKEVFINDVRKEYLKYIPGYYWSSIPDSDIVQAFINIPLIVGEEAIGVISVQSFNKNVYTKEHLEILKSLASFMSVALNNADAYTQLNSAKENLIEQKRIIEEKNKDILDSIRYAKRIQTSLLPTDKYIERNLNRLRKS